MNERQWRWSLLNWILLWVLLVVALYLGGVRLAGAQTATSAGSVQATSASSAQVVTDPAGEPPYYELRLYLRHSDGTAVTGEPIILERLPQELPMPCETDALGVCTWTVGRGLYQALFDRPLDQISALSLAEGGLRGFGVTVGEADIAYHFTYQPDGRAYFDGAPEAAVPVPIIPSFDSLQGGAAPTPNVLSLLGVGEAIDEAETAGTARPTPTKIEAGMATTGAEDGVTTTTAAGWQLVVLVGLGLLLGTGLHLLQTQRRRRWLPPNRSAAAGEQPIPVPDDTEEGSPHA
jgi:hypothetical protein